jgi:hemerythrin superfamily protein
MDAIKLLEQQHREVESLFEKFESAEDTNAKMEVFTLIADMLSAHTSIEEKIFYPSIYVGPTADKLREAVEEHLSAKRVIADLLDMDAADEQFTAKMKVLQELVEHHVEEEEDDLFPTVRKLMAKQELEVMGEQMESSYEELIQAEPRNQVPAETDEAAPLS